MDIFTDSIFDANGDIVGKQKVAYISDASTIYVVRHNYEIAESEEVAMTDLNLKIDKFRQSIALVTV